MTPNLSNPEATAEPLSSDQALARLEDVQRLTEAALSYLNVEDLIAVLRECGYTELAEDFERVAKEEADHAD